MVTRLRDITKLIRSKNAGPFVMTIDIVFRDPATFDDVVERGVISKELVASLYRVESSDIEIYRYRPGSAIKISFPRPVVSGDLEDNDVMAGQFYGPLVDVEI